MKKAVWGKDVIPAWQINNGHIVYFIDFYEPSEVVVIARLDNGNFCPVYINNLSNRYWGECERLSKYEVVKEVHERYPSVEFFVFDSKADANLWLKKNL